MAKQKGMTIGFYASIELREQIKRLADEEERTVSAFIRRFLEKQLLKDYDNCNNRDKSNE